MSKVILSFLLLVVLQSVMTEEKSVSVCPPGVKVDKTGKCIPAPEKVDGLRQPIINGRIGDVFCPHPWKCSTPEVTIEGDAMSKVMFSFFLLMVLQVLLTEGHRTPKPKVDCPPGMAADRMGKCTCFPGLVKDSKGKCVPEDITATRRRDPLSSMKGHILKNPHIKKAKNTAKSFL
ncbi:UNVERIFIED_CONTAM: hypothetical protein PYX00_004286 [Menopon gallinae]|uniref:Secreted protein n=1 Tax=Menopon gallinae TaxID=328185 RepID=A0AAW2I353_9NEOP